MIVKTFIVTSHQMLLYLVCSQKLQKSNNTGGHFIYLQIMPNEVLMSVFSVFETNIGYKFTARKKTRICTF